MKNDPLTRWKPYLYVRLIQSPVVIDSTIILICKCTK